MAIKITLDRQPYSVRIFEMVFTPVQRGEHILYVNTWKATEITDNLPEELQKPGAVNKLLMLAKAHNLMEYTSAPGLQSYPSLITQKCRVNIYCGKWHKFAKSGDRIQPFYDPNEYRPLRPPEISASGQWYVGYSQRG